METGDQPEKHVEEKPQEKPVTVTDDKGKILAVTEFTDKTGTYGTSAGQPTKRHR